MNADKKIEAKRQYALDANQRLIDFLNSHNLASWSHHFQVIIDALESRDFNQAISLNKSIPEINMGAFGNFHIQPEDGEEEGQAHSKFVFLAGVQSKSIGNIRVYLEYELDHDLQNLDFGSLSDESKKELLKKLR